MSYYVWDKKYISCVNVLLCQEPSSMYICVTLHQGQKIQVSFKRSIMSGIISGLKETIQQTQFQEF